MRITTANIRKRKAKGERFAAITAYDVVTARLADEAGVPLILVGDSLGMVVLGYSSTIPVTLDDIVYHTRAVVRGSKKALVVADLPFMTYQKSPEQALDSAGRCLQEAGAQAVKLEGGRTMAPTVARLTSVGIPVMGHIGLTPQSVHQLGGFKAQGKNVEQARELIDDAQALQEAGAFSIVLDGHCRSCRSTALNGTYFAICFLLAFFRMLFRPSFTGRFRPTTGSGAQKKPAAEGLGSGLFRLLSGRRERPTPPILRAQRARVERVGGSEGCCKQCVPRSLPEV